MTTRLHSPTTATARAQRGQYIIMIVVILALGVGFLIFSVAGPRAVASQRNAQTEAALAMVKQALIGYAAYPPAKPSNTERPGELPCPDLKNDGFDDGSCVAGAIGRVPWKTLGIPEPKDGSGETLWYALAGPFRNKNMSSAPIDSDTLGTLTVYQDSSATTQTGQAVAVLFAPGPALSGQSRGCTVGVDCDTSRQCTTTPPTLTNLCNPANYMESTGGGNNAQTNGPFIQAATSATFNDRVMTITTADLMPIVEQRVASDIMALLELYRVRTGTYPWADLANGDSNGSPADGFYNRNRFPCHTAAPTDWGALTPPITLPDWLTNGCPGGGVFVSGWTSVIYLGIAKNTLPGGGSACTTCFATSTLTVTNPNSNVADLCLTGTTPFVCTPTVVTNGNADLVLITPGSTTASRAAGWSNSSFSPIVGYFEDSENSDNNDDTYVVPTSTKYDRDRMYIVR